MMETLAAAQAWVMGLGAQYGVNPIIFGAIYVGAIPFFLLFTGIAVTRPRAGIPVWVWGVLGVLIAYGAWSAVKSFREKLRG